MAGVYSTQPLFEPTSGGLMHSRAILRFVFLSMCLAVAGAIAQQVESAPSVSKAAEQSPSARQSAMSLIEEVLAGTNSLSLPSNRLAIELRAFPIIWTRGE